MTNRNPETTSHRRIGIDFDNTIAGYDDVFLTAAIARGLVPEGFAGSKQAIRDVVRSLPDGELEWRGLQGYVYGQGIENAVMFDGLDAFLSRCRREGHAILIVSHKTEFGHFDRARVSLRQAALGWMRRHRFFSEEGYAIPVENVYFEGSRPDKLKRIAALGCTHFIDDLEEVLSDPDFPPTVERILFSATADRSAVPYPAIPTWHGIVKTVLDARI